MRWARATLILTAVGILVVSVATPLVSDRIFERWFTFPNIIGLAPIPTHDGRIVRRLWVFLARMPRSRPFARPGPLPWGGRPLRPRFLGLAYSFYPYVVPERLTIWQAASAPERA